MRTAAYFAPGSEIFLEALELRPWSITTNSLQAARLEDPNPDKYSSMQSDGRGLPGAVARTAYAARSIVPQ